MFAALKKKKGSETNGTGKIHPIFSCVQTVTGKLPIHWLALKPVVKGHDGTDFQAKPAHNKKMAVDFSTKLMLSQLAYV